MFQKINIKIVLLSVLAFSAVTVQAQDIGPTYVRHDAREHIREPRPEGYGPVAPYQADEASFVQNGDLAQWCTSVTRELQRSLGLANLAEARGDYSAAARVLVQGLKSSDADVYLRKGPMTAKAIVRAIQLAQIVEQSTAGQSNSSRAVVNFVSQYYQFIINTANNLDLPTYAHYQYCGQCNIGSARTFEANFVQFAKDEVQIILDVLTVNSGYQVYPVGSLTSFVNALSLSISFASEDLRESLFAARYSCSIRYLDELNSFMHSGSTSGPDLMNYAYSETSHILSEINPGYGCFR